MLYSAQTKEKKKANWEGNENNAAFWGQSMAKISSNSTWWGLELGRNEITKSIQLHSQPLITQRNRKITAKRWANEEIGRIKQKRGLFKRKVLCYRVVFHHFWVFKSIPIPADGKIILKRMSELWSVRKHWRTFKNWKKSFRRVVDVKDKRLTSRIQRIIG